MPNLDNDLDKVVENLTTPEPKLKVSQQWDPNRIVKHGVSRPEPKLEHITKKVVE